MKWPILIILFVYVNLFPINDKKTHIVLIVLPKYFVKKRKKVLYGYSQLDP